MKAPIRMVIVEDDDEIRLLTKEVVEMNSNITCPYLFNSAEAFLSNIGQISVDLVLMDIGLPGMSGTDCVRHCQYQGFNLDFIMYTTHINAEEVFDSLKAGAKGYILKGGNPAKLVEDIFDMVAGGSPMSPQISRLVADSFNQFKNNHVELQKLTKQEWEVLRALDKGMNYKEIAASRFVSAHTVRAQIRSIYEKLQVHSKLEAIKLLRS